MNDSSYLQDEDRILKVSLHQIPHFAHMRFNFDKIVLWFKTFKVKYHGFFLCSTQDGDAFNLLKFALLITNTDENVLV